MSRVIETKDFDEQRMEIGNEWRNMSKSDVEYGKIPIKYDKRQLLLKVPKCKTMGVQSTEMDNGFTRRVIPLVFESPLTNHQEEFANVFFGYCTKRIRTVGTTRIPRKQTL